MKKYVINTYLCIHFFISIFGNIIPIEFDFSLLSTQETLTTKALSLFLTNMYQGNKNDINDFGDERYLQIKKLNIPTVFYTLQIFKIIYTHLNGNQSTYIIKETKNGSCEAERFKALEMHPEIKKLTISAISSQGLPTLNLPFAYFSYRNQKSQIHYITIMPVASGISLADLIMQFRDNQSEQNATKIARAYKTLGYELGNFHQHFALSNQSTKIGKTITHGDFHCCNIFYDEIADHCTFIDNETMAHSLQISTDASIDIIRLFLDFFSVSEANFRKNLLRGIDLGTWHNIALRNFLEGYLNSYRSDDWQEVVQELKAIFNADYTFSWFRFKPHGLEQLRKIYINPILKSFE